MTILGFITKNLDLKKVCIQGEKGENFNLFTLTTIN